MCYFRSQPYQVQFAVSGCHSVAFIGISATLQQPVKPVCCWWWSCCYRTGGIQEIWIHFRGSTPVHFLGTLGKAISLPGPCLQIGTQAVGPHVPWPQLEGLWWGDPSQQLSPHQPLFLLFSEVMFFGVGLLGVFWGGFLHAERYIDQFFII